MASNRKKTISPGWGYSCYQNEVDTTNKENLTREDPLGAPFSSPTWWEESGKKRKGVQGGKRNRLGGKNPFSAARRGERKRARMSAPKRVKRGPWAIQETRDAEGSQRKMGIR